MAADSTKLEFWRRERTFQKLVLQAAVACALNNEGILTPQGTLLLDLKLSNSLLEKIIAEIASKDSLEEINKIDNKEDNKEDKNKQLREKLSKLLGLPRILEPNIFVKLDDEALQAVDSKKQESRNNIALIENRLQRVLTVINLEELLSPNPKLVDLKDQNHEPESRQSIIDFTEECVMHARLKMRVLLEKVLKIKLNEEERKKLFQELDKEAEKFALEKLLQAIEYSQSKDRKILISNINKFFDSSRKKMLQDMTLATMDVAFANGSELMQKIDEESQQEKLEAAKRITEKELHQHFISLPAHNQDYIYAVGGIVAHYTSTNETSHNKQELKEKGDYYDSSMFAARQKRMGYLLENGEIESIEKLGIRVPSLNIDPKDIKHATKPIKWPFGFGKKKIEAYNKEVYKHAKDIKSKLQLTVNDFKKAGAATNTPIVYNLLTSLPQLGLLNFFDQSKNKQRASAKRIILGAHLYNANKTDTEPFIFIENIPVNQHGDTVKYTASVRLVREARLMADIAMLSNLAKDGDKLYPHIKADFEQIQSLYKKFLQEYKFVKSDSELPYFCTSEAGKQAIKKIKEIREEIKEEKNIKHQELPKLIEQALANILASSSGADKQFGLLTQVLSAYLEDYYNFGCKSGNERTYLLDTCVEYLLKINPPEGKNLAISETEKDAREQQKKILVDVLKKFNASNKSFIDITNLQNTLEDLVNKHHLQGSAQHISFSDQGAAAKVIAQMKNFAYKINFLLFGKSSKASVLSLSTNVAVGASHENLKADKAGKVQAHSNKVVSIFKKFLIKDLEAKIKQAREEESSVEYGQKPGCCTRLFDLFRGKKGQGYKHVPTFVEAVSVAPSREGNKPKK